MKLDIHTEYLMCCALLIILKYVMNQQREGRISNAIQLCMRFVFTQFYSYQYKCKSNSMSVLRPSP